MLFFFLIQLLIHCFLNYHTCLVILGLTLSSDDSVLKLCSLNDVATKFVACNYIELFLGFKFFVNSRFPRVTKSLVDKLLNKLMKKCFGIDFFKLVCSLKKSMACVNIA
jgi:hypothetical protein